MFPYCKEVKSQMKFDSRVRIFLTVSLTTLSLLSLGAKVHAQAGSVAPTRQPPVRADIAPQDLMDWRVAENADTKEAYGAYLRAHPQGWFKAVATSRLEAGLQDMASRPVPADPMIITPEETAKIAAWEEAIWQSAKTVGTHNSIRAYLLTVPRGSHTEEASRIFLQTYPRLPAGTPSDCKPDEWYLKRTVSFNVERAFPARAIDRGVVDKIVGDVLVDTSGRALAWMNAIYTHQNSLPEMSKGLRLTCVTNLCVQGVCKQRQHQRLTSRSC
jgi:hypothetical protein